MTIRHLVFLLVVWVVVIACGGSTATTRPSASLVTLEFTPAPASAAATTTTRSPSPTPSTTAPAASWPVGWDVAFCNAFVDLTVTHELLIDIERAIEEDNRADAQALANELAQIAPITENEVTRMTEWDQAAELKADLTTMLDLDKQASVAYVSYFTDEVRPALREARQLRNQVRRQVEPVNEKLAQLTALGVSCPGTDLTLEDF